MAQPVYKGIDENNMPQFEPQQYNYAVCDIQWRDGTCSEGLIFKLNCELIEEEDERIFFYAEDYESFLSLCQDEFREDFRVLTIHKLYKEL